MVAAIEAYNRPAFAYRAETFAILAINAWELLLKARLIAANNNNARCLLVTEPARLKNGGTGTRIRYKRNRAGNFHTKGLSEVLRELQAIPSLIPVSVRSNLDILMEIRDNCVHFPVPGHTLSAQIESVATASVLNFATLTKEWFNRNLATHNLAVIPIAFASPPKSAQLVSLRGEEQRLANFIRDLSSTTPLEDNVSVTVTLDFRINRTTASTPGSFTLSPNGSIPARIAIPEDESRTIFRWSYDELITRLKQRYSDFKANTRFHGIKKDLLANSSLVYRRLADPLNPSKGSKDFFNPSIVLEFDKHYARRDVES